MRASSLWQVDRALLALHAAGAALAWFRLPPHVPIHFDFGGTPDAWARTSPASWFGLLAISIAVSWFVYVLTTSGPLEFWNIPEKQRSVRLSPEQQAPTLDLLRAFGAAVAICATLLFLVLHAGVYLTALGVTRGLLWYIHLGVYGPLAALFLALIPWT